MKLLELLAIEGGPTDNLDSPFAKLGTGNSRLPNFATPNKVFTTIALHGREKGEREGGSNSPITVMRRDHDYDSTLRAMGPMQNKR